MAVSTARWATHSVQSEGSRANKSKVPDEHPHDGFDDDMQTGLREPDPQGDRIIAWVLTGMEITAVPGGIYRASIGLSPAAARFRPVSCGAHSLSQGADPSGRALSASPGGEAIHERVKPWAAVILPEYSESARSERSNESLASIQTPTRAREYETWCSRGKTTRPRKSCWRNNNQNISDGILHVCSYNSGRRAYPKLRGFPQHARWDLSPITEIAQSTWRLRLHFHALQSPVDVIPEGWS